LPHLVLVYRSAEPTLRCQRRTSCSEGDGGMGAAGMHVPAKQGYQS
jgi:hypothetical protein